MAYNYLDLTNEVLARMNEVALSSSNFTSSRGFQTQCKNAVNDAISYVNQREFNWPFNHVAGSQVLVAEDFDYSIPADAKTVDYETFRIVKDDALGTSGGTLRQMDYKEYVDKYIQDEDDTSTAQEPRFVIRTPDNNFKLYPMPDAAYTVRYDYFAQPTQLTAFDDVPNIPEAYRQIIADGATAYAYQYRGEQDQYQINFQRFEAGITHMQSILSNRFNYVRDTRINRGGNGFYGPRVN